MICHNESILTRFTVVSICIALLFAFLGCADRELEPQSNVSEDFKKASEALAKAEELMKKAEIDISFSDLGSLGKGNITEILPTPDELSQLEKENPGLIQEAAASMYDVFDALPGQSISIPTVPLAPTAETPALSKSDFALLHLHLSYLYVLKVVGRLVLEGMGPNGQPNTPDDLFLIEVPEEVAAKGYKFELTDEAQTRFDAIDKLPSPKPEDYLKEFTESQRQAVIDSLLLLLGAKVKILPIPASGIKEQTPQIDLKIYRRDVLFHLEKAIEQAKAIAPDLEDAFDEFNRVIAEVFAEDLLKKAGKWHFKVENIDEVEDRLRKLVETENL